MSEDMKQIPFHKMMDRVWQEYAMHQTIYGVRSIYKQEKNETLELFGQPLENPFGPAAGPHTQLAQNLVASYVAGGRFFELKTVQILDGKDLPIDKPCIRADDEAYNVEWSTELYLPQAAEEYVKGYYALKLIAKELQLGDPDAFIFNMSVGYNLEGIKSEKVDTFINTMKDASTTGVWAECQSYAMEHLAQFKHVDQAFIASIKPTICNSITLSTMHGCPANEVESIVTYLMQEKGVNTYLKCNPTLLGYDFCRNTLNAMNYDYITFDRSGFDHDLQYSDAVMMLKRLIQIGKEHQLTFGVKLSNTFHVKITRSELPGKDMYMSGKALYPLTINLAAKLAKEFDGKLPMSFSGGIDRFNIKEVFEAGIWPITVATILLKPTGYNAAKPLAQLCAEVTYPKTTDVNVEKVISLAESVVENPKYRKTVANRAKAEELLAFGVNTNVRVDCAVVCGACADVCPNRANIVSQYHGKKVLLHIDDYCNECGNCYIFCADKCTPYKDRMTLFSSEEALKESTNQGFVLLDKNTVSYRLDGVEKRDDRSNSPKTIQEIIDGLETTHPYLI
ncbi:selenate reductase (plasmid) [Entomospira entomophila]|uniref:Selenate reductase n=1 Tax=Entomospira entomophila TaxID=2719988 RepID=A0A968GBI2_9SPIO|nr:selenate reductase [Entomospira entomophilus]NIZ41335.1 selenate reductase [Entomospira entomophilus]WDI36254.1 selenate reductase [Entomospira entomophilus]